MKNSLQSVLNLLADIKYGYVGNDRSIYPDTLKDWDKDFGSLYHLQSPEELINSKYGVCWDQVELERYYLSKKGIQAKSYYIISRNYQQERTHTFIVVNDDNKYYWLEHSWETYKGIHEYTSLNELLKDIQEKFEKDISNQNINNYNLTIYEYSKPKYNISCIDFMKHCENGLIILSK